MKAARTNQPTTKRRRDMTPRRRLTVEDRRRQLERAALGLIGTRAWSEVSMDEVAHLAGASKPLLYHYFATKRDLYVAAVRSAAEELRAATTPSPEVGDPRTVEEALSAHLDWINRNADAYRAILQGAIDPDPEVSAIVEASRDDVIVRLSRLFGLDAPTAAQRLALRGWVGFLEGVCFGWLESKDTTDRVPAPQVVEILTESLAAIVPTLHAESGTRRGRS